MAGRDSELPILGRLKEELAQLQHELHTLLPRELEAARAHGDLSENAEYEACKERQRYLAARIAQVRERIQQLSLYNRSSVPEGVVAYGSEVTLEDLSDGSTATYQIVFPEEADVPAGRISLSSPLGRALLNRMEGDTVEVQTPRGKKMYAIVKLVTLHTRDSS